MGRVEGKTAIVTGGASGIGRATSILLAKEGAKVAVVDIQDDAGRKVVSVIESGGDTAGYWHMDVSDIKEVEKVCADIYQKFGKIDVLVNDAGIMMDRKPSHEIEEAEWDRIMNVNLKGVFLCTKHVVPYMIKDGRGSIINLSSMWGIVGEYVPPYCASKGGVRLLTKADALSYAVNNIRVNSVHPGGIMTPLVESAARKSPEGVDEYLKKVARSYPVGHIGEPIDIAFGILYLASDEARFVTGSELVIDGGYTAQ
ncbi:SDR family NAD(P)-dependent oxidoreductase [Chloroflexota bacterium]